MKRARENRNRITFYGVALFLAVLSFAFGDVKLAEETVNGQTVYRLENERVSLLVNPAQGGNVTSFKDKKGGNVELVHQAPLKGLCMDHFQAQYWPGEMLAAVYTPKVIKQFPGECVLQVTYEVKGDWRGVSFPRLSGLLLEKTYTLRVGNPVLECRVKFTAPRNESRLFSYWQQNVFFPGGRYEEMTDVSFRPSIRGVRRKTQRDNGHYGPEYWLRDFNDGWMALLDTKVKTGLVVLSDYHLMDCSYANGGNESLEPMYRIQYLPPKGSVEYITCIVPVVGLDNVVAATEDYVIGYSMQSDGKGSGSVELAAVRSLTAPKRLTLDAAVVSVDDSNQVATIVPVVFENLGDDPQVKRITFTGAGKDPLVFRVRTAAQGADGKTVKRHFEDYHNGTYAWGENIQVDMTTPYYAGKRPAQELRLQKPEVMQAGKGSRYNFWYAEGFMDPMYDVTASIRLTSRFVEGKTLWRRAFAANNGAFGNTLSAFPYDYEELLKYNVIILGGVKADALNAIGIEMLSDFLAAGGGMVVLGGPMAYSFSGLAGTKLEEMWPVSSSKSLFAIKPMGDGVIEVAENVPLLQDLDWSSAPRVQHLHEVTVKPWGKTILTVAGKPFLVIGQMDPKKGRVACILGAPIGTMDRGKTPFWEWSDWRYLMRQILWWVGGNDSNL